MWTKTIPFVQILYLFIHTRLRISIELSLCTMSLAIKLRMRGGAVKLLNPKLAEQQCSCKQLAKHE